jgi:hypothetical protein
MKDLARSSREAKAHLINEKTAPVSQRGFPYIFHTYD